MSLDMVTLLDLAQAVIARHVGLGRLSCNVSEGKAASGKLCTASGS